jgi:hypothetical protein
MTDLNHSNTLAARPRAGRFNVLILLAGLLAVRMTQAADLAATNTPGAIPWNQIGAKAGADYKSDGLAVTPTESGARLRCVFQRLDGEATPECLWLTSTVTNALSDRFRVTAMEVGRVAEGTLTPSDGERVAGRPGKGQLPRTGSVSICGQTVRFGRPGMTEEYSVSMDGVRQDFIVEQAPSSPPAGELVVKLAVSGADVEPAADGARLVLTHSGRKIAYSRLRVMDATGKELSARIEVCPVADQAANLTSWSDTANFFEEPSTLPAAATEVTLAVVVNDANAVYPVRIDPTFSDANWVSMGGLEGVNGRVNAAVTDGSGNLYIGGAFTNAGGSAANHIAQWNGSSWSALGSGMDGPVLALAASGNTVYAGGAFTNAGGSAANYIAQWNGSSWSALGSGISSEVLALAASGNTVYAGGAFTNAGGSAANSIAQWNGNSWSALGSGISGGEVYALAVSGSRLYAGGAFTNAGGSAVYYVAQWNGSAWSDVGSGLNSGVFALVVSGSTLYAGGNFATLQFKESSSVAQWNGTNWSDVGSGMQYQYPVLALAVSGSTLYAGGDFTSAGGSAANYVAQWNGANWSALGSGISGGDDLGPSVLALAVSGGTLYAGGDFTSAAGNAAYEITQWNGSSWSALGSGMSAFDYSAYVNALAVSGSTLYAGGAFTSAGTNVANNIAQWNGSSWSALGSGVNSQVNALAVSGSTLYVGGDFSTAGGSAANYVAQWNGTNWSALGSGTGGSYQTVVQALAMSGSTLYAGGEFTTAGGSAANGIAQWNGNSWSPLGSGVGGSQPYVFALAVSGSTLYAGGNFTSAGGSAANCIAQWDGTNWSALGPGMDYPVSALAVLGSTLYVGGDFTKAGGSAANYIAQWNGSSWSGLGSGMSGAGSELPPWVAALVVSGSTLYAGGYFTIAGTNVSAYVAMANLPVSIPTINTNVAFGFANGVFGFNVSGPAGSNVVIQASTDLQTWIPMQTNQFGSGPLYFSDPQSPANVHRFYRAQLSP